MSDPNDYLQIEFIQSKQIQSVTIYGRATANQWVTSYYFQYSVDGVNFINAFDQNNSIIFTGNVDDSSGVYSSLAETIIAKYVRIIPFTYNIYKSLRVELFGYDHPCQYIYGGDWSLVRHSYNAWHNATDNLQGTDVYGTYDNNPQSLHSWSIQFDDILESSGSSLFMFSNGDCSEWMVVENNQFNTQFGSDIDRHIIASHYDIDYYAKWYNRVSSSEDPWISWNDHTNYESLLYGEDSYSGQPFVFTRFNVNGADKNVNVWIS